MIRRPRSLALLVVGPAIAAALFFALRQRSTRDARRERLAPSVEAPPRDPDAAESGLRAIDDWVATAIAEAKLPGCVVTIGRRDRVLFQKAYGFRAVEPERIPMTADTVFDLASLTKPIATATSIMILVDRGKLALDDSVERYVPELAHAGQPPMSIRQLLTHASGLPAETVLDDYKHGIKEAIRRIARTARKDSGTKFIYSDVGYVVLGEVVERVAGQDLATFAREAIFAPLGMNETGFLPPAEARARAAPTEMRDGSFIVGTVHDPRAYRLGGVAGNAGLFSTAGDLVRYAEAVLGEGALGEARIMSTGAARTMRAPHDVPGAIRALGWDVQSSFSTNRGESLSRRSVGHGGYTGTALWIDPGSDLFVLFLSNRVHPDGKGAVNPLIAKISTLAGQLFGRAVDATSDGIDAGTEPPRIALGIDVLRAEHFARLAGANVGLVTNASGRAADGTSTIDLFAHAPGVHLVALFSPEHGLRADVDRRVASGHDDTTHLPVYSLYGEVFEPTDAMLKGIDTLVFDIQDAGARFFTYASTLHRVLRVAAKHELRLLVLDRPNPIDGVHVAGPLSRKEATSFVNHHPLPIRHGMTLGEVAEMINADEHLGAKLEVVLLRGWHRGDDYDQTGLPWRSPSPNLRTVAETVLYPGIAIVEGTNVSVGRGTDTPFELVGAPWIDERLAQVLGDLGLEGVAVEGTRFTPEKAMYGGELCKGVKLRVTDRRAFDPIRLGLGLARALRDLYRDEWHADKLDQIIGNPRITAAILDLAPIPDLEAMWTADLATFIDKRRKYLLY
ncbi:MAG TPA: serine hydrolase [Polyangiaceae bacterium]|nr:serine hydrolase [Polyangiaceae bacterium]